ncbi:sialate O-acetylesterase-like [Glandiceps talaboti]
MAVTLRSPRSSVVVQILVYGFFTTLCSGAPKSSFQLASYYGNHMVLQMEPYQSIVWGYGEKGATVEAVLKEKVYSTQTYQGINDTWIWRIKFDAMPPSGPFDIQFKHTSGNSTDVLVLQDILFGDVWVCSGQSNMEFTVFQAFNASEEAKDAINYPDIRLFAADKVYTEQELFDLQSVMEPWTRPSAKAVANNSFTYFSAVCWFYGRDLYNHFKYPIGLIDTTWGGTPIEAWSSADALAKCNVPPYSRTEVVKTEYGKDKEKVDGPDAHMVLWNAMIHPFLNMTIKGAIWYQGEANAHRSTCNIYNCTFPAMITDWRYKFNQGSQGQTDKLFPFGFVQLSTNTLDPTYIGGFPLIRWHQTVDYGYVPNAKMPNTFMAVAMDLGDPESPYSPIHPRYKQDVGYRLSLSGRAIAYGEKEVKYAGPFPTHVAVQSSDNTLLVEFDDQKTPIEIRNNEGFEVCCSVTKNCTSESLDWQPAPITKPVSTYGIKLSTKKCDGRKLEALRYEWRESPCSYKNCSIYSAESSLPTPPFIIPLE